MRRNFLARGVGLVGCKTLHLLIQQPQLLLHRVELRLLAHHCLFERIDQVFGKCEFGFDFGEPGLCPSRKAVGEFGHGGVAFSKGNTSFSSRAECSCPATVWRRWPSASTMNEVGTLDTSPNAAATETLVGAAMNA